MNKFGLAVVAAAFFAFAGAPSASFAQADMSSFANACLNDPVIYDTLVGAFDGPDAGIERFCACVVVELQPQLSDTDADIYARSMTGDATDEELMNYGTFEDLDAVVTEAQDTCMVTEGFADGYDPGAVDEDNVSEGDGLAGGFDTAVFFDSCFATDWTDFGIVDEDTQGSVCSCMTNELPLDQSEVDQLIGWYDGYSDYEDVDENVMAIHNEVAAQCIGPM
ncbi:MAG: hypothetical protein JWR75_1900 [Devosia sp.]|nr:hypothetical protein [Devosia sp.]